MQIKLPPKTTFPPASPSMLWTNQRHKETKFAHMDRNFINYYSSCHFPHLSRVGMLFGFSRSSLLIYNMNWHGVLCETKKSEPQTNKNALKPIFKSNVKLRLRHFWPVGILNVSCTLHWCFTTSFYKAMSEEKPPCRKNEYMQNTYFWPWTFLQNSQWDVS